MSANRVQLTAGGVLAVVGVTAAVYLLYRGSNAVGEAWDGVKEGVSNAAGSFAQTVYPDSLLAPNETVTGKLTERYNAPGDTRSFWEKAWDGYWQDVSNFWGGSTEPDTWGREARTPTYTGGASGSW